MATKAGNGSVLAPPPCARTHKLGSSLRSLMLSFCASAGRRGSPAVACTVDDAA